jgi:PKD repeat protein
VSVSFSAADTGSGVSISSGQLQRASAVLSNGGCGVFGGFAEIGPAGVSSPYSDTSISSGNCYEYRYLVSDNVGNQAMFTSANVVKVGVPPPLIAAFAFSPSAPQTGQLVSVDGSTSTGTSATTTYSWTFGDGAAATGSSASHVYAHPGTYTITLTVADGGSMSQATHVIMVADRPPIAAFSWLPGSPLTGQKVTFDGSGSSDPDGTVSAYAWIFGDGSLGASGVTTSHSYTKAGTYTVQLTITDDSGSIGAVAQSLTVAGRGGGPHPHAPVIRLRIPKQRLASVLNQGLVILVSSDQAVSVKLQLKLARPAARALGIARSKGPLTVAAVSRRLTAGKAVRVKLTLSRGARRRLAGARALRLTLVLTATGADGRTSLSQVLSLRR